MTLNLQDLLVFLFFNAVVVGVSIYVSLKEKDTEDYFLAGRSLKWWAIGISLISANISTEHFVGMAGRGYELGLAIASYEWMAAITLIVVGAYFLPKFLKSGIYTVPEYLEYRYGQTSRTIMAVFILIAYVVVSLASMLYSGALAISTIFNLDLYLVVWVIGIFAGVYTVYGGLKAVVFSDVIFGSSLIGGGVLVTVLGFKEIGGLNKFLEISQDKLHTVLPWDHPEMPWVAVFIGGLWIPNLFYWGLNQFIFQKALAARSLAEGQKGILFAAFIKLIIPFIIVFPGIMAIHLYADQIQTPDQAYPVMMSQILPAGFRGFMLAALLGAIIGSLDSVLNSASTIFTIDIYQKYIRKDASQKKLVSVGRITTAILVLVSCLYAPMLKNFGSVFHYLQMIWGFISPGIVVSFLFGMLWPKVPEKAASGAMLLGIPIYAFLLLVFPQVAFLHHMAITFICLSLFVVVMTLKAPLLNPKPLKVVDVPVDLTPFKGLKPVSALLFILTAGLYIYFY